MASYYPSFTYMGLNSLKDKRLKVVAFDTEPDEADTFLGMDAVYTDNYNGTKRIDYGAKFNSVAVPRISVIKLDNSDFTVAEVRDFLKWTTGIREISYLDLVVGNEIRYSFLGRVRTAYQRKINARTIGFTIEFESVSPWAYSPEQHAGYSSEQTLAVDSSDVMYSKSTKDVLGVSTNSVLYNNFGFQVDNDGVASVIVSNKFVINNQTDDLYTPIYLNAKISNGNLKNNIKIKNKTLNEETIINNIVANEEITLSNKQFILSDNTTRIFGNDFNYVWPRLKPGINDFEILLDNNVDIEFTYRYPIKIGDCAMNINDLISYCGDFSDNDIPDTDNTSSGGIIIYDKVSWNMVEDTPTTINGYGITDAYTTIQVDNKLSNLGVGDSVNENNLNSMLDSVLGD